MANDLEIKRCWFHGGKKAHYDIPKTRFTEISNKCNIVSSSIILKIILNNILMENFYFTFGYDHVTKSGVRMLNNYVKVEAENYEQARLKFIYQFTSIEMHAINSFAFQYDEKTFLPHIENYKLKEYKFII